MEYITTTEKLWLYEAEMLQERLETAGLEVQRTDRGFMVDKTLYHCRVKP